MLQQVGLRNKLSIKPLEISGIWMKENVRLRTQFKTFAQTTFSIINIHQIANKTDVETIINGVCQNYGLSFSIDADFTEFLQLIVNERTNWFSEWDAILNIL